MTILGSTPAIESMETATSLLLDNMSKQSEAKIRLFETTL